jgi:hypothetical protein
MTDLGAFQPSANQAATSLDLGKPNLPSKRYRAIFTTLKKELPVKLTTREGLVLHRAVRLTLMAELAAADPTIDLAIVCRLENLSRRARVEWTNAARARAAAVLSRPVPSVSELMERHRS